MITNLFNSFSAKSRRKKIKILESVFPLAGGCTALDIGGDLGHGVDQLLEKHEDKGELTVVNYDEVALRRIQGAYPNVRVVRCDARQLPFPDETVDLVYSNAVIEHVGNLEDQAAMAREIMRVGKRWFITTPNRWYPFEFHTRLPFVSWLPEPAMTRASRVWSYNHKKGKYQRGLGGGVRLMTVSELKRMFPDSYVIRCRVTFWPETLIVVGPRSEVAQNGTFL